MSADFTPEQRDYKKIGAFKFFCMQNFPFIADTFDQMTYYELLCKLAEYIKKLIDNNNALIYNQEALLNAYNELQQYINDYFSDLNLQNEVNNKIDSLVEQGYFENILAGVTSFIKIIDTTSELLSTTEVFYEGEIIETLGYSTKGDNGGAKFIIKDNLTANGYTILELDCGLYAEMIIQEKLNVNSFGADYTGQTDSSTIFNYCLNLLNDRWLNDEYSINVVECTGTYLIESTITVPVWLRLRGTGYTIFKCNVNGSAFKIGYISQHLPANFIGHKQDYEVAQILDFNKGCLIRNTGSYEGTIGVEIGTSSNWGTDYNVARTKFDNLRISWFATALKFNVYHNYIISFEKCNFESNTTNVQFGDSSHQTVTDSGENITFQECIFSGADYAFKWYCDGFDVSIINSSIDFINQAIFYDVNTKGYRYVKALNCHIELKPVYFVDGFGANSMITIECSKIYILDYLLESFLHNTSGDDFRMIIKKCKWNFPSSNTSDPTKLLFYDRVILKDNFYGNGKKTIDFVGNSNNILPSIDSIPDGTYPVNYGSGYKIHGYKFSFNATNISENVQVVTDDYGYTGHKSFQFSVGTATTSSVSINVETPKIYNKGYKYINLNSLLYNCKIPSNSVDIKVAQYDSEDNLLTQYTYYHNNSPVNTNANQWHIPNYIVSAFIRPDCHYFKLTYNHGNINNNQEEPENTIYKIGGLYAFE